MSKTEISRAILKSFSGYDGRPPTHGAVMTHAQIASVLGLSRQRVEQIERVALKKLRRAAVLKEFAK